MNLQTSPVSTASALRLSSLRNPRAVNDQRSAPQAALAPARAMYHVFGAEAARRIDTAVGFANVAGGDKGSFRNFAAATGLALRSAERSASWRRLAPPAWSPLAAEAPWYFAVKMVWS